eukprot:TRINITY_DN16946_c0_g1_i1.p1 TRINITY_DN16946_c0_g1~~TRINITY_DN16946_c0_g1_i1.p1  ORF type:complete len:224 (+),score=36.51 TRINITY_DN16946_c0_g1_i1:102-674(+)
MAGKQIIGLITSFFFIGLALAIAGSIILGLGKTWDDIKWLETTCDLTIDGSTSCTVSCQCTRECLFSNGNAENCESRSVCSQCPGSIVTYTVATPVCSAPIAGVVRPCGPIVPSSACYVSSDCKTFQIASDFEFGVPIDMKADPAFLEKVGLAVLCTGLFVMLAVVILWVATKPMHEAEKKAIKNTNLTD